MPYELADVLSNMMMRQQGTEALSGLETPAISPTPAAAPQAGFADQLLKALQTYNVPIAQMGEAMMGGKETIGGQVGGVISGTLASQKLNEALRKMVSSMLAGGGKGFSEGQPVELTGADVAGLTPEQVGGVYSTGLKLREAELKRPLENIAVISDAYLKVMSGEAKPAEAEKHLTDAMKAREELAAMPIKNLLELHTKIAALKKADAEIAQIQATTVTERERPAQMRAEVTRTKKQVEEIEAKLDPRQVRMLEFAKTAGGRVSISEAGDRLIVTDPATGAEIGSFTVGVKPETAEKKAREDLPLKKFAMQRIAPLMIPHIQAEIMAKPGGKRELELQNLLSSLRSIGTGEIDPSVVIAKLSPADQERFNKAMDIYVRNPQLTETELGRMMGVVLGTPSAEAAKVEKPGEKPIIERGVAGKPAAPHPEQFARQLQGKPAGVYESDTWRVKWDGKAVTSIEPKAQKSAPSAHFGTF